MHYFSDASEVAYGAVASLRLVDTSGAIHCSFVTGKSRLSPLKPVTISRLELSSAVLSTRLDAMIQDELELEVDETIYWTDSTCVLRYIANKDKHFQTFVANRVTAIREPSLPNQWRYLETAINPADDASRGVTIDAITGNISWFKGLAFLWQSEEHWPKPLDMSGQFIEEILPQERTAALTTLTKTVNEGITKCFNHFSSWLQLKKCVAWILRYKSRLRRAVDKRKRGETVAVHLNKKIDPLHVSEMEHAERAIVRAGQLDTFHDELTSLSSSQGVVKKSSSISK